MTPKEQAAARARAEELRKWRLSSSTDPFKAFRRKFTDAGIDINILHLGFGPNISDNEIDYFFQMAKTIGAKAISSLDSVGMSRRIVTISSVTPSVCALILSAGLHSSFGGGLDLKEFNVPARMK